MMRASDAQRRCSLIIIANSEIKVARILIRMVRACTTQMVELFKFRGSGIVGDDLTIYGDGSHTDHFAMLMI